MDHLAWKKNARHLYDTLLVFELPWPSLTVQVFPEIVAFRKRGKNFTPAARARLLLGTHTADSSEMVRIGELSLPDLGELRTLEEYDADTGAVGGHHAAQTADLRLVQRIPAKGAQNRLRYMPQNPNLVAGGSAEAAAIWDITKFPYKPVEHYLPTAKLVGHSSEVLGVDWSPTNEGVLATCDSEGHVWMWDLGKNFSVSDGKLGPTLQRLHYTGEVPEPRKPSRGPPEAEDDASALAVNDIHWHPRTPHVLASVGDNGWLHVHLFVGDSPPLVSAFLGGQPSAVAWNPVNESLLAVGFACGRCELWDVRRKPAMQLHRWQAHASYVTRVVWNTWHPTLLATASEDTHVKVWNAGRLGDTPLFVHGGHTAPVTDVAWSPLDAGVLVSVAEDNALHYYKPILTDTTSEAPAEEVAQQGWEQGQDQPSQDQPGQDQPGQQIQIGHEVPPPSQPSQPSQEVKSEAPAKADSSEEFPIDPLIKVLSGKNR